jgi:hypothetical protein
VSTLDWGTEWLSSLIWIAVVFVLTTIGFAGVSLIIARYTGWDGQVWRLTGPWLRPTRDRASWGPAPLILVMLALIVVSVRLNVLLSYNTNALYTALQRLGLPRVLASPGHLRGPGRALRPAGASCLPGRPDVRDPALGVANRTARRRLAR